LNVMPAVASAGSIRSAVTPVESLSRFTANATADAVVPLVNVRTSTPSVPVTSSVTDPVIALAVNWSSAVRALVTTSIWTGIVSLVPKFACVMFSALTSAAATPDVM
jgi:hypothetical protein